MAAVTISAKAFSDPRIKRLGRLLGTSAYDALGRLAHVWRYCTEEQVYAVGAETLTDLTDCEGFAEHLVAAELGEPEGNLIRLRGLAGRIEWLEARRSAAVAGGRARARNAQRDEGGRLQKSASQTPAKVPADAQPNAGAASQASSQTLEDHQPNTSPIPIPISISTTTKDKKIRSRRELDARAVAMANQLLDAIRSHKPDFALSEAKLEGWAGDIEPTLKRVGDERLLAAIEYAHRSDAGSFWRANILSGRKLCAQLETLEIQMRRPNGARAAMVPRGSGLTFQEVLDVDLGAKR